MVLLIPPRPLPTTKPPLMLSKAARYRMSVSLSGVAQERTFLYVVYTMSCQFKYRSLLCYQITSK